MAKRKVDRNAVIVAVIGAVALIIAAVVPGLFDLLQQQIPASSTSSPATATTSQGNTNFDYSVRVQASDTSLPIPNAKVTIEVIGQAPLDEVTDSNGIARFFIDTSRSGQPARLIIRTAGFKLHIQNIDLRQGVLPDVVALEAELSSAPTATIPVQTKLEPTSTPECPAVAGIFAGTWANVRGNIGCASDSIATIPIVDENFERGKMMWRGESIDHARALVLFNNGTWKIFQHAPFVEGSPEYPCTDSNTPAQSPPTPKRGFGAMWCDIPEIRNGLGNAVDAEREYSGYMQRFNNGFMMQTDYNATFVLYDSGVWEQR